MTNPEEKELHLDRSREETTRYADASPTNGKGGKLVQDIADKYRPTVSELASAQLDHIRTELRLPPVQDVCTPENTKGVPNKAVPELQAWDGITRQPPKSVAELQMEYAKIMSAPLRQAAEMVIGVKFKETFGTAILVYKFFDGLDSKMDTSPPGTNRHRSYD